MPTLFDGYRGAGEWLAVYSISIFFLLRAGGRFLGAWMLTKLAWNTVLSTCSGAILACFVVSIAGGLRWAVYLLPFSGLFMSVIYPTVNSKGISCVPKTEHGAAAGVILFLHVPFGRILAACNGRLAMPWGARRRFHSCDRFCRAAIYGAPVKPDLRSDQRHPRAGGRDWVQPRFSRRSGRGCGGAP